MKTRYLLAYPFILLQIATVVLSGCTGKTGDSGEIESIIRRYNHLVAEGYRSQNMNPIQEVTTPGQALKLYYHMAALGEGKLRMDSRLKNIRFNRIERRGSEANVETEEIWDFTQYRMDSGGKYAEEKDFTYRMGYILQKNSGRWIITQVTTISGTSANPVIPWPVPDRNRSKAILPADIPKPAMQK